ncbi:MAG: hypothetical protein J5781_07825, partial [Clostridia bacterium]|nr:hypothetical protein [Clostridia bacterium]
SGYIRSLERGDYYVSGAGRYSASLMEKDVDYVVNMAVGANVYRLVNGRMIPVLSTENYMDGIAYYYLDDSGFIKYSDINDYYVDGTGYYSRRQMTAGVDYNVGDGIGNGVYVSKNGRYVLPEELTFRYGTTYYLMDNSGLVFGGDLSSYCISGEKYYSFNLLAPVENTPVEGDVFVIESGMFLLSTDTVYRSGKDYYLRTNAGLVDSSDLSGFYVDATGYYTLVEQVAGTMYTVGGRIPNNMYYEISADGICRVTKDGNFVSGKKYYLFRADNTYLPANADLSGYYFESNSEYGVTLLINGKDYEIGDTVGDDVYTVDDKWYSCLTSGVYEANKRYLVFEAAAGYIRYDDVASTFVASGNSQYMAVPVTEFTAGEDIPVGYYTRLSDGRMIAASGAFIEGETYYLMANDGFIYAHNEKELYLSDARYYSFIEKDVSALIGSSASGSYIKESDGRMIAASGNYSSGVTYYEIVNSGLVQLGLLGEYYVSGEGRYSVKRTSFSTNAYVYLKNNEYIKTTDLSEQEGTEYFTFTTGGYVKSKNYSQYYVPSSVFRTDLVTYNYYRYGNNVPYAIENGADNYYYKTVAGRVFEKSGDNYSLTEDNIFIVGKDYYLFVPVTDFSARETADGLFVFRKGYVRAQESYAALRKADAGIDYQVGSFVSGRFFTMNANGVPFEVPNGSMFSADTTYYCLISYYGITEIPTYYELQTNGSYSVTTDRTFNTAKTYYTFSQENVVVGNLIPQGYYFVKNGADFVQPDEETFLEGVTYYTVRMANVTNNAYVVKGLYEKVGDIYIVTVDTVMDGNKKYYRFAKDLTVDNSDPVRLYEKVGEEYVLTDDARTSTGKTYYNFKQSAYSFTYFTGSGAPYYTGVADLSALASGVYYTGANNFTSSANFSLKIISTPFKVEKQVIHVTGVERQYYDRTKSNWKFVLADDTEMNAEIMNILYSARTGFIQQLEDKSSISEDAGSYYTKPNGSYYMTLSKTAINEFNNAEDNNYYIVFDGVSVSGESSDNVCIPLYIKRVPIVVSMTVPGTVEYGVKPEKSELISSLRYSSYPDVSTDQTASRAQREFFNFIEGNEVIDFDAIIKAISTTDYNDGESTSLSLLYNLKMNPNAINSSGFDNYSVSFGEIVYTIAQRRINIQINPNRNYYDSNSAVEGVNFSSTPFTVLYSDVNSLFYDDSSRDYKSYSLKIDTFTSGDNVYSVDNLSEQIIEIVSGVEFVQYVVYDANNNNTVVATGATVQQLCASLGYSSQYTDGMTISQLMELVGENHVAYRLREVVRYKNVQYDSIQALLNVMTQYVIEDENGNADYMAGVNYIRLYDEVKWYDSNNYILISAKTPIIVYPEIDSVGEYDNGKETDKKYINLIADTEAVFSGNVTVNKITKEISNLSFIMRLNMNGMKTQTVDYSTLYVDSVAFSSEYELYYYVGNRYTREMHVYYVSGGTEAGDGSITLKIGDVITVTVTVTENFNNFAARPSIESLKFKIRLVEKMIVNSDETTVSVLPLADTTDTVLYNGSLASDKLLPYGKAVQNSTGEYVLYNPSQDGTAGVDIRKENYDMLSMRVRLTPAIGSDRYSFTSTLYENSIGKLVFVITGGTERRCFIRYYYKEDYYSLNTHTVAQSGVTYYQLTPIDGTTVTEANIGNYYLERGGLIYRAYGSPDTSKTYYTLAQAAVSAGSTIANPSSYAVKFSEDALSAEGLGDIFDGKSHRLTFYLDRSGYLYDTKTHSSVERTVTTTDRFVKNGSDAFDGSRTYFTAELKHLTSDVFVLDSDYFVLKNGYLVKPDHAYAKENVDYYLVQLDSTVTAGTLTADHYYAEDIAQESLFIYCPTTYDALKKYYVYLSVDGDAVYSSASTDASKVILSFTGGLYKCDTTYSKTLGDNAIIEG